MKCMAVAVLAFASVVQANVGFQTWSQAPLGVREASKSVYKIWVPGGPVQDVLAQGTAAELRARLEQAEREGDALSATQWRFCLENQIRPCVVMSGVVAASSFLMGRGDWLWTSHHVFSDYLDAWRVEVLRTALSPEDVEGRLAELPLPMLLFDRTGQRVAVEGLKQFVSVRDRVGSTTTGLTPFFETFRADWVVIQLPQVLGAPLAAAQESTDLAEENFVLGFPETSELAPPSTRELRGHLRVSQGPRISQEEALSVNASARFMRDVLEGDPLRRNEWSRTIAWFAAESRRGSSGGPIVNREGHVVAIAAARQLEDRAPVASGVLMAIDIPSLRSGDDLEFLKRVEEQERR